MTRIDILLIFAVWNHLQTINLSRIMKTDQTKNYGEYVDITAAIQETVVTPHDLMGGEIWYN